MKLLSIFSLLVTGFLLVGCTPSTQPTPDKPKFDMTELNYKAAEKLLINSGIPRESVVIMATVVNIDEIEKQVFEQNLVDTNTSILKAILPKIDSKITNFDNFMTYFRW